MFPCNIDTSWLFALRSDPKICMRYVYHTKVFKMICPGSEGSHIVHVKSTGPSRVRSIRYWEVVGAPFSQIKRAFCTFQMASQMPFGPYLIAPFSQVKGCVSPSLSIISSTLGI
jgi:hypothetical protein